MAAFKPWINNTSQRPVLNRLVLIQSLIALLGVVLAVGLLSYFQLQDKRIAVAKIRQLIIEDVDKNKHNLFAWSLLGLDKSIERYELNLKDKFPDLVRKISISKSAELTTHNENEIVSVMAPFSLDTPRQIDVEINLGKIGSRTRIDWRLYSIFGIILIFFLMLIVISITYISHKIYIPLSKLRNSLNPRNQNERPRIEGIKATGEILDFVQNFEKLYSTNIELEREAALSDLATQVAHDIRSPLAALSVVCNDISSLSESRRLLLRAAMNRIQDIANSLLADKRFLPRPEHHKIESKPSLPDSKEVKAHFMWSIIESILSEKRIQFSNCAQVSIDSQIVNTSYDLFCKIDPCEFKRVLSNVVNNAVESIERDGSIRVTLDENSSIGVRVCVTDNGRGIPSIILPKLMTKSGTFGKQAGTGLGLFHAKETVGKWGGSIEIDSEEGRGTSVSIHLPKAKSPQWFAPALFLKPGSKVVILDDDPSIHDVWKDKLVNKSSAISSDNPKLFHCLSIESITAFLKNEQITDRTVFLLDYELIGELHTGLDIAEHMNIHSNSYLVTSHFENAGIQNRCRDLGMKLIPKNVAGFIPLKWAAN